MSINHFPVFDLVGGSLEATGCGFELEAKNILENQRQSEPLSCRCGFMSCSFYITQLFVEYKLVELKTPHLTKKRLISTKVTGKSSFML